MGFLNWLKNLFHKSEPKLPECSLSTPQQELLEKIESKPKYVYLHLDEELRNVRLQIEKLKEEAIKEELLPSPKTKRKTHTHSYTPPAEQHRDSISKFMKGKASNRYLKTIKQSPKIKIEEDN
jgi:hypothetical protein